MRESGSGGNAGVQRRAIRSCASLSPRDSQFASTVFALCVCVSAFEYVC